MCSQIFFIAAQCNNISSFFFRPGLLHEASKSMDGFQKEEKGAYIFSFSLSLSSLSLCFELSLQARKQRKEIFCPDLAPAVYFILSLFLCAKLWVGAKNVFCPAEFWALGVRGACQPDRQAFAAGLLVCQWNVCRLRSEVNI